MFYIFINLFKKASLSIIPTNLQSNHHIQSHSQHLGPLPEDPKLFESGEQTNLERSELFLQGNHHHRHNINDSFSAIERNYGLDQTEIIKEAVGDESDKGKNFNMLKKF